MSSNIATASSNHSKKVVIQLYRSLLRASRPFTYPSPHSSVLTSLLHRKVALPNYFNDKLSERHGLSAVVPSSMEHNDDERSSTDRSGSSSNSSAGTAYSDDDDDDSKGSMDPPHYVLFTYLLQELMGDGRTLMRFPSQLSKADLTRLRTLIQREFRPNGGTQSSSTQSAPSSPSVSHWFSYQTRIQASFLALRELNKKLYYALSQGFHVNAATTSIDNESSVPEKIPIPAAIQGVSPIPCFPPSSYLKPGTVLLAHPFIDGFFSQTVVVILDHTDDVPSTSDPSTTSSSSTAMASASATAGRGGTYGLIINKPAIVRKRLNINTPSVGLSSSSTSTSTTSTRGTYTMEAATVSDVFQNKISVDFHDAFYDSLVRIGGPVHSSVQMLYKCTQDQERSLQLGGRILPEILPSVAHMASSSSATATPPPPPPPTTTTSMGEDGGTQIISDVTTTESSSEDVIYFQGDFNRVARAVLEGKLAKDSVSFVVGATAWSPGQLQSEIERGWWIPCTAPLHMTLTGKYALHTRSDNHHPKIIESPITILESQYLWQSLMAGIGEGEAKLAYIFRENRLDENSDACDEFL